MTASFARLGVVELPGIDIAIIGRDRTDEDCFAIARDADVVLNPTLCDYQPLQLDPTDFSTGFNIPIGDERNFSFLRNMNRADRSTIGAESLHASTGSFLHPHGPDGPEPNRTGAE